MWKYCLAGVEALFQSPVCRKDARETQATKAVEATAPGDICTLAMCKTFLTQEEIILPQTGTCCLFLPRKKTSKVHLTPFEKALHGVNKPSNKTQDKD